MNALENWFCSTEYWRRVTQMQVLPSMLSGSSLGEHVLEIGAGAGAATKELRRRGAQVTSLEWSHAFAARLAVRVGDGSVVQGDAAVLPFVDASFSSAIAVLVLHHLRSTEQQDLAFREIHRVLRPGGVFFAFEIPDGWLPRVVHWRSTFVPLQSATVPARLAAAGFSRATMASRRPGFQFQAFKRS
jgi:ubiquinone/menaquinone biosynthesis C-methylase UbiE